MNLYKLSCGGMLRYVEGETFDLALEAWHAQMAREYPDSPPNAWQPESVEQVSDEPVIRAVKS